MISGASTSMSVSSAESLNGSSGTAGSGGGEVVLKKGPWTAAEDKVLVEYVERYGEGNWNAVRKKTGLLRCGKSCRLRWTNHLRPNLKKGSFTPEEEWLIIELHSQLGNKWARMAAQMPGRTDNEIKNFWNTRIKRRLRNGLPLYPHSQKPRQASPSQLPPPPQSAVVKNQLLMPQYQTAIPLFHSSFQSGFHDTAHVFDQTSSTTLPQHTLPLPVPPPRHKRCRDSAAFSISIPSATLNDHPSLLSSHGILPHTPLSFNRSSMQMEMGAMPSPSSFSVVNPELPSIQSQCSRIMKTEESCSDCFLYSNTRVLGDVTEEARARANAPHNNFSNAYSKSEMNRPAPDLVIPSDAGITHDTSPIPGINPFHEDQVKMSDSFPPNTHAPTPDVNCGRNLTIGPLGYASWGVQDDFDDNLGLDLHDIAALFPGNSMVELPEIY